MHLSISCWPAVVPRSMHWWAWPRSVEAEYRVLKAAQSALDNNDLLRMAYEALRDYPAIRAAYEGRFKMVMIDEFQDTDQMQVDLIRYLTGAGSVRCVPWAMRSSRSIASAALRSRCSVARSARWARLPRPRRLP